MLYHVGLVLQGVVCVTVKQVWGAKATTKSALEGFVITTLINKCLINQEVLLCIDLNK